MPQARRSVPYAIAWSAQPPYVPSSTIRSTVRQTSNDSRSHSSVLAIHRSTASSVSSGVFLLSPAAIARIARSSPAFGSRARHVPGFA
jgi:hypothetical protein